MVCKTFMRRFDPDPRLHKISYLKVPPTPPAKFCGDFCGGNLRPTSTLTVAACLLVWCLIWFADEARYQAD
jgi:hypothetical protein